MRGIQCCVLIERRELRLYTPRGTVRTHNRYTACKQRHTPPPPRIATTHNDHAHTHTTHTQTHTQWSGKKRRRKEADYLGLRAMTNILSIRIQLRSCIIFQTVAWNFWRGAGAVMKNSRRIGSCEMWYNCSIIWWVCLVDFHMRSCMSFQTVAWIVWEWPGSGMRNSNF